MLSEWMLNEFPGNFFNMHTMSSQVTQLVKYLPAMWEIWVWSPSQENPLEKRKTTHSSILAGDSMDRGA